MSVRVGYICEAGGDLGWGHAARGLALLNCAGPGSALVVGRGWDQIRTHRGTGGDERFQVVPWSSADQPLDPVRPEFDVLVVDHYQLKSDWIARAAGERPTWVVDDWVRDQITATGVLNQNLGAAPSDYAASRVSCFALGVQFALLRRDVREAARRSLPALTAHTLLVTLGASDPEGHTADVVADLVASAWYRQGGSITGVLGASYLGREPWVDWPAKLTSRLDVVRAPNDFAARCAAADVVICGAGVTSYEMAHLGTPFVPLCLVENQRRIVEEWRQLGVGAGLAVWDADWRARLVTEAMALLHEREARTRFQAATAGLVDGNGPERFIRALATGAA